MEVRTGRKQSDAGAQRMGPGVLVATAIVVLFVFLVVLRHGPDEWLARAMRAAGERWPLLDKLALLLSIEPVLFVLLVVAAETTGPKDWRERGARYGTLIAAAVVGYCLAQAYQFADGRWLGGPVQRPFVKLMGFSPARSHKPDASFPSDCATIAFAWAWLVFQWRSPGRLLVLGLVLCHVMARAFTGIHWVSDVLVGGPAFGGLGAVAPAAAGRLAARKFARAGSSGSPRELQRSAGTGQAGE